MYRLRSGNLSLCVLYTVTQLAWGPGCMGSAEGPLDVPVLASSKPANLPRAAPQATKCYTYYMYDDG